MGKPLEIRFPVDPHPTEDALEEYAFDRLPENDTATLEEHLLVCADCQNALSRIDAFLAAIRGLSEEEALAPAKHSMAGKAVGYGIGLAVVALGLAMTTLVPGTHSSAKTTPVHLVAFRGGDGATMASAEAGATLDLSIDLTGIAPSAVYRLQIVDERGSLVWRGEASASDGTLKMTMAAGLKSGIYWVRLYSGGELLREFGLRAQ